MTVAPSVLLVEDEPDVRQSLREIIEEEGYRVADVADGRQALEYLRAHEPPTVVLLDLMMPVMDGWQVLRAMRADAALARIPVIVISAAAQATLDEVVAQGGASSYIRKPIALDRLLAALKRICGREA
jgi:CheY-like chemotaxis protein